MSYERRAWSGLPVWQITPPDEPLRDSVNLIDIHLAESSARIIALLRSLRHLAIQILIALWTLVLVTIVLAWPL